MQQSAAPAAESSTAAHPPPPAWVTAAPAAFVVGLLLLATAFQGAFELRHWGPPAIFGLLLLATILAVGGGAPVKRTWLAVLLTGIWGLAAWTLLSAVWSPAPSEAWEAGARTMLYAVLVTVPAITLWDATSLRIAGYAVIVGIAGIAVITLVRMLADGPALFLAGRLDDPVGYRNASALLFCLGVWPLLAVMASREAGRWVRAGAFSLAVLELGLAFLTQSRGMLLGLLAGGLVAVALGPDRVRRCWVALLAAASLAAFAPTLLTPYDAFDVGRGVVTSGDIATAANGLLLLTVLAFAAGFMIALFDAGLRPAALGRMHIVARVALILIGVVAVVGAVAAVGDPVQRVQDKWSEFTDVNSAATGTTRLTFAGGQRSDLWRVSLRELRDHPLIGAGAGGYPFDYYRERRSDRNLDDPHGLVFQVGGELGLVGLLLLAMIAVGAGGAIVRGWRTTPPDVRRAASAMAAVGAVLVGQLAVDWMWLIPGVTGIGLFCLATSAAMVVRASGPPLTPSRGRLTVPRALMAAGLLAAAASTLLLFLSDFWVREARAQAGLSAARQYEAAHRASGLSPLSVTPHYLMASALESEGRVDAARRQLLVALRLEPLSITTMALLGDLEARRGAVRQARLWYGRASALNPLDVGLAQLARTGGAPSG